jgi:ferric-dicitrate binding protein FerR (iron transport regulator)
MPTFLAACALATALACAAPFAVAAQNRDCEVAAHEGGAAEIWRAGEWAPVAPGPLPVGEAKIRTGEATRLEIGCSDGLRITVAPDSEVNLEALIGPSGRGRDVVLQLLRGLIGLIAPERTWRRLETRTGLAIAAARATSWLVQSPPGGGVAVFVKEGRVAVTPAGRAAFTPALLSPGEGITVGPDGAAAPAVAWSEARTGAVRAALGLSWR